MPKCLCSNDLNRYVTVEQLVLDAVADAITQSGEWNAVGNEWCQMISNGTYEWTAAHMVQARNAYIVTMRWSPAAALYTAKMRINYGGRIFNFAGPPQNVDEKDKWIRILAIEVPSENE